MNFDTEIEAAMPLISVELKVQRHESVLELELLSIAEVGDKIFQISFNQIAPFHQPHIVDGVDKDEKNLKDFLGIHNNTSIWKL